MDLDLDLDYERHAPPIKLDRNLAMTDSSLDPP